VPHHRAQPILVHARALEPFRTPAGILPSTPRVHLSDVYTMTSFNPLPSHLQAVQEEYGVGGSGMATPSYGGTVETGAEWDFVIDKHGRRR